MMRTPTLRAATLAALAFTATGACAQTTQIDGVMDVFAGSRQWAGAVARQSIVDSGGLTTSRWGLSSREDLGDGLKAGFAISGFLRADTGEAGRFGTTDGGFRRFAYVELDKAGLGTLRAGRISTPTFLAAIRFNPMADSTALSPILLHTYTGGQPVASPMNALDSAADNTLAYLSPNLGGFSAQLHVAPGEVVGETRRNRSSAGLFWSGGPAAAGLAIERSNTTTGQATGVTRTSNLQLGGSYDLGVAKLFAQLVNTEHEIAAGTREWKSTQLGASVPAGGGAVLATVARTKKSEPGLADVTRTTAALGYDYPFSRRTDAYAVVLNDKLTAATSGNTLVVGLRHRF